MKVKICKTMKKLRWTIQQICLAAFNILTLTLTSTKVIRERNKDKPWLDDQCRNAFVLKQEAHLRWKRNRSKSRVSWEDLVRCQVRANETYSRSSISLVPETGMFFWMTSLLISGGPLLSLLSSAWVRHCHRLLVEVVDWCESRLAKLICSRIILMASSPESLFIYRWCASNHPVCLSERSGYLWCTFVRVAYTAKCIGEWSEGNRNHTDWFQRSSW